MRALLGGAAFAGAVAAILVVKSGGHANVQAAPTTDVFDEFTATCTTGNDPRCPVLHAAVVAHTINNIEHLVRIHERSTAGALALQALAFDEPQLQLYAAGVLKDNANQPGATAAIPLVLGPHPALQRAGARLLANGGSPAQRLIGERWQNGHPVTAPLDPFALSPTPPAVAAQFPAYPGVERYTPGDSSHSVGYRTGDAIDKVVTFYAKSGKRLDAKAWGGGPKSQSDIDAKELTEVTQEFQRTHDMKLVAKMQDLAKKVATNAQKMQAQPTAQPTQTAIASRKLPEGEAGKSLEAFVVEGDIGSPIRAVAIYREESIKQTIVELVWNADKYPAWH